VKRKKSKEAIKRQERKEPGEKERNLSIFGIRIRRKVDVDKL